jgi:transposase InsO family protein
LDAAIASTGARLRYLITDQGPQFTAEDHAWCKSQGIEPRYASKRSLRATWVIERFFRSLKAELLRPFEMMAAVDVVRERLRRFIVEPAQEKPRFEPRPTLAEQIALRTTRRRGEGEGRREARADRHTS